MWSFFFVPIIRYVYRNVPETFVPCLRETTAGETIACRAIFRSKSPISPAYSVRHRVRRSLGAGPTPGTRAGRKRRRSPRERGRACTNERCEPFELNGREVGDKKHRTVYNPAGNGGARTSEDRSVINQRGARTLSAKPSSGPTSCGRANGEVPRGNPRRRLGRRPRGRTILSVTGRRNRRGNRLLYRGFHGGV